MARNFKTLRTALDKRLDALPEGRGAEIRKRVKAELDAEIAGHEQTLADLRRARALTQIQMSTTLGVTQAQVSRIEHQTDLYISTLQSYLEAMGGELQVVGVFPARGRGEVRVPLRISELDA